MSSIIKQKVGKHTYLYESTSYRDADGRPRNSRKIVGKVDPETNIEKYKREYIAKRKAEGNPLEISDVQSSFNINEIKQSRINEYGAFYLYKSITEKIGLYSSLQGSLGKHYNEVFTLATYLVSTGDPFLYCEDWINKTECLPVGSMSPQRISEIISSISHNERESFYCKWAENRSESEYLALDITSISSYSELIEDVEWGYNRDDEKLPQINLCLLTGEKSRLPIYQTVYSGSLKDVTTLKTTLAKFKAISNEKPILVVMDKGFYSAKNINMMLKEESEVKFVISVPFSTKFAKNQVKSENKDIDSLRNTIVYGADSIRGITKVRTWDKESKVYTHVYYNPVKATKTKEELYAHVTVLKELAEADTENKEYAKEFEKYLLIRKSDKRPSGYSINIREDVVNAELETAGWMVIISNEVQDAKRALSIYRDKDVVEKGFLKLKNNLELGRLRVHREDRMQNKIFIAFIALILMSLIHKVMTEKNLYKSMTMKKLLLTLSKLRIQNINDTQVLYPLTKEQKQIFEAFEIDLPL